MALRLLFFAQSAEWVKQRELSIPWESRTTINGLLGRIPALLPLIGHQAVLKVAVNQEFSDFDAEVDDGDEIAFLPPVSGG